MLALKKKNEQLFRRIQKPKEDIETKMDNFQAKQIASAVGIQQKQKDKFNWFFELVSKLKVPNNFKRHLNSTNDRVIYFNQTDETQSFEHPSINIIKIFFYQALSNNKAVYTFLEKQRKLLPFVEEKMMKQAIGLNSKRRDAEKVNLQRDESGRMVMSKLERIMPDTKSLITSRSYMLKMLVEKIFTKKEIWGKGKRANTYNAIINEYRHLKKTQQPDLQDENMQNQQDLQLFQSLYHSADIFYFSQFGDILTIPDKVMTSPQYKQSTPENILRNVKILNISKSNIQLYWFARVMDCMPMPPNWTKRIGQFDSYCYQPEQLMFDIHPSYIYIMTQMNQFRTIFQQMPPFKQNYYLSMRFLSFYDYFERFYTVDMYGYIQSAEKKQEGKKKARQRKIQKNDFVSDWMIVEGINQSSLPNYALTAIEQIERFWTNLNFQEEPYFPSISPYGSVAWSSSINSKSINFCPYQFQLKKVIESQMQNLPHTQKQHLKIEFHQLYEPVQSEEEVQNSKYLQKMLEERDNFLEHFLNQNDKACSYPYEITETQQFLNEDNFYQQIFITPFLLLDEQILPKQQKMPLWFQKCKAQNYLNEVINCLNFEPKKYNQIKEEVFVYASEMTEINEPYAEQELNKKKKRVSNSSDLINFLRYVTDLDQREIRKQEYLKSMMKQEDSDIFGSDISQVDIDDEENQSSVAQKQSIGVHQQEEEEKLQIQQKPLSQKNEDEQVIFEEPEEEEKQIIQVQQRVEYEFLANFKKEIVKDYDLAYLTNSKLDKLLEQKIKKKERYINFKEPHLKQKIRNEIQQAKQIKKIEEKMDHYFNRYNIMIHFSELLRFKKENLITTNIRTHIMPEFTNDFFEIDGFNNEAHSQYNFSEITDYDCYQSQMDIEDTDEIKEIIRLERLRKLRERTQEREETIFYNPEKSEIDRTEDSIILEPIKQVKPEIRHDPVLRFVKNVSQELSEFRKTFNRQTEKNQPKNKTRKQEKFKIRKSNSVKTIKKQFDQKQYNYYSTNAANYNSNNTSGNIKTKRQEKKISFKSNLDNFRSSTFKDKPTQPFHRVCLANTASHFLEKQALLKKGDLITLEARKTLMFKGRGLETFVSKFY